jgi:hypothetical protein
MQALGDSRTLACPSTRASYYLVDNQRIAKSTLDFNVLIGVYFKQINESQR